MDKGDKKLLLKSLDVLSTMGHFAGEFASSINPLRYACAAILDLAELAAKYGAKDVKTKILRELRKIHKGCCEYESDKKGKRSQKERAKRQRVANKTLYAVKSLKWGA